MDNIIDIFFHFDDSWSCIAVTKFYPEPFIGWPCILVTDEEDQQLAPDELPIKFLISDAIILKFSKSHFKLLVRKNISKRLHLRQLAIDNQNFVTFLKLCLHGHNLIIHI